MKNKQDLLSQPEILSRSWQEIKKRFAPFMLLACGAPAANWLLTGLAFGFNPLAQNAARQQNPVLLGLVSFAGALISTVFLAALVILICKRAQTPAQALKLALPLFWRVFAAGIVLALAWGALLALAGAIIFGAGYAAGAGQAAFGLGMLLWTAFGAAAALCAAVYFCLLPYPLILAEEGVFSSFRTSFLLVKGFFWNTLGLLFILGLICAAIGVAAALVLVPLSLAAGLMLPQAAWLPGLLWIPVTALTALTVQVPLVALYLDRSSGGQEVPADTPSQQEGE